MNLAGIVAKLDRALTKVTPLDRLVYLRTITQTGGDQLIGRPGTSTFVDVLLKPQPYYSRLGRQRVTGDRTKSETTVSSSGKALLDDDYMCITSPTAVSESQLQDNNVVFTMVDSAGAIEVMRIIDFDTPSAFGGNCAYIVYLRSVQRP